MRDEVPLVTDRVPHAVRGGTSVDRKILEPQCGALAVHAGRRA